MTSTAFARTNLLRNQNVMDAENHLESRRKRGKFPGRVAVG
jgi:hypothetical protein